MDSCGPLDAPAGKYHLRQHGIGFFLHATNGITNTIQMAGTTLTVGAGFKAQGFSSDGSLDGQIEPLKLRLREGFSANGTQTFTAGTTNRYFDIIITPTGGRVKYVQP